MMLGLGEGVFELSNLRVDVHSLRLASDAVESAKGLEPELSLEADGSQN
jgi:hypothetical protein